MRSPLRERYHWGPQEWPLWWCQIAATDQLDCGGFAALSLRSFEQRGMVTVPVQLLERFDQSAGRAWKRAWAAGGGSSEWTWGDLAYHEAVGFLEAGVLKVWDPTDGCWVEDRADTGYGSTVAVRVVAAEGMTVMWQGSSIRANQWYERRNKPSPGWAPPS